MIRRAFTTGLLFALAAGCEAPGPVTTVGGSDWQPAESQPVQTPASLVAVTVLGETQPDPRALAALHRALRNARESPLENRALMLTNLGIAAAHMGALDDAAAALDEALEIVNALIYDPKKSREIARLSGKERTKVFKGEPHERALCNMYRGIVHLAEGNHEAARSCFIRGDMEGAAAGKEGKWLSLEYLAAVADDRCVSKLGGAWMRDVPEELETEPFSSGENTLVVAMSGLGPLKQHKRGGKEHGLTYGRYASQVAGIELAGSEPIVQLSRPTEELFLQAVSNGRRQVDAILAAKQQTAETGEAVGDVAETIAPILAMVPYGGLVALPLAIGGTISTGLAVSTESTADLRTVVGPGAIYIATLPSGDAALTMRVKNAAGAVIGENAAPPRTGGESHLRVVLVRIYR